MYGKFDVSDARETAQTRKYNTTSTRSHQTETLVAPFPDTELRALAPRPSPSASRADGTRGTLANSHTRARTQRERDTGLGRGPAGRGDTAQDARRSHTNYKGKGGYPAGRVGSGQRGPSDGIVRLEARYAVLLRVRVRGRVRVRLGGP